MYVKGKILEIKFSKGCMYGRSIAWTQSIIKILKSIFHIYLCWIYVYRFGLELGSAKMAAL